MRGKEIITKLIIPGAIAMIICHDERSRVGESRNDSD